MYKSYPASLVFIVSMLVLISCNSNKEKQESALVLTAEEVLVNQQEDQPQAQELEDIFTLFVASELVDCVGVSPMKCMQVRQSLDEPWELMYSSIEGFDYEPGYEYQLEVRSENIANPPADASSIRFILVSEISKIKK
ncbi:DUF4377 domain-containing protein [Myroides sp. LJL119]